MTIDPLAPHAPDEIVIWNLKDDAPIPILGQRYIVREEDVRILDDGTTERTIRRIELA